MLPSTLRVLGFSCIDRGQYVLQYNTTANTSTSPYGKRCIAIVLPLGSQANQKMESRFEVKWMNTNTTRQRKTAEFNKQLKGKKVNSLFCLSLCCSISLPARYAFTRHIRSTLSLIRECRGKGDKHQLKYSSKLMMIWAFVVLKTVLFSHKNCYIYPVLCRWRIDIVFSYTVFASAVSGLAWCCESASFSTMLPLRSNVKRSRSSVSHAVYISLGPKSSTGVGDSKYC